MRGAGTGFGSWFQTSTRPAPPGTPFGFDRLARWGLLLLLAYGCWRVLEPFVAAILFSLAIAIATWPVYRWLAARLGGRRNLASAVACLAVSVLVIGPAAILLLSIGDAAGWLLQQLDAWRVAGPVDPPEWLARIPVMGEPLAAWLREVTSGQDRIAHGLSGLIEPARGVALAGGRALGSGLAQTLFAGVLLFFLYRDGVFLGRWLEAMASRIGGDDTGLVLETMRGTLGGVMVSVFGTALAQATVATIGFSIAQVPSPLLLGAATFVLSMAPFGPPLIWGGAAFWLFQHDRQGWALFMVLYGALVISMIDNVVKPLLISRSSRLPVVLTFVGVIGGVLAFGAVGVFIGPTILALVVNLGNRFSPQQAEPLPRVADPANPPESA